jgi:hypothetical protein
MVSIRTYSKIFILMKICNDCGLVNLLTCSLTTMCAAVGNLFSHFHVGLFKKSLIYLNGNFLLNGKYPEIFIC